MTSLSLLADSQNQWRRGKVALEMAVYREATRTTESSLLPEGIEPLTILKYQGVPEGKIDFLPTDTMV